MADFRQDESETMADLDLLHQADCQGVPMAKGVRRGANDRLAVPCHHLLQDT